MSKCSAEGTCAGVRWVATSAFIRSAGTPTSCGPICWSSPTTTARSASVSTGSENTSAWDASSTITTSKIGGVPGNCSSARSTDMIQTGTAVTASAIARWAAACQCAALLPVPLPILRSAAVQSASAALRRSSRISATSSHAEETTRSDVSRRIWSRARSSRRPRSPVSTLRPTTSSNQVCACRHRQARKAVLADRRAPRRASMAAAHCGRHRGEPGVQGGVSGRVGPQRPQSTDLGERRRPSRRSSSAAHAADSTRSTGAAAGSAVTWRSQAAIASRSASSRSIVDTSAAGSTTSASAASAGRVHRARAAGQHHGQRRAQRRPAPALPVQGVDGLGRAAGPPTSPARAWRRPAGPARRAGRATRPSGRPAAGAAGSARPSRSTRSTSSTVRSGSPSTRHSAATRARSPWVSRLTALPAANRSRISRELAEQPARLAGVLLGDLHRAGRPGTRCAGRGRSSMRRLAVTWSSQTACQLGSRTSWPSRSVQLPSRRASASAAVRRAARPASSTGSAPSRRTPSGSTPRSRSASTCLRRGAQRGPLGRGDRRRAGSCPSARQGGQRARPGRRPARRRARSASTANSAAASGGSTPGATGSGTIPSASWRRSQSPTSPAEDGTPARGYVAASRSAAASSSPRAASKRSCAASMSAASRATQAASASRSSVAARSDSSRAAICSWTSWSAERPSTARHSGWISSGSPSRSTRSGSSFCASTSTRLPCATRWQMRLRIVWVLPVPGGPCTATLAVGGQPPGDRLLRVVGRHRHEQALAGALPRLGVVVGHLAAGSARGRGCRRARRPTRRGRP